MLIHAILPASRANGPGLRAVVFVQGCSLNCSRVLESLARTRSLARMFRSAPSPSR